MTNTPETNPTSVPDEDSSNVKTSFSRTLVDELKRIWKVTQLGVAGLYKSQLPRMAAALAYRTIFSVIPVMAIGLLIFGSIVSDEQVESGVRRVLTFAGISQISSIDQTNSQNQIIDENEDEMNPDSQEFDDEGSLAVTDPSEGEVLVDPVLADPFAGADLEQVITDLINRVNSSIRNVPTGWIALTSGLVLFYAAMSMLIEIEKAFNQICGAPSGRGWLRRLMLYWTILTAGSLLLAATFLAGDAFTRWVVSFAGQDSMFGAIMAGYGVSVLISTLLLLGAYLTIPNTRMQFRPVLAGAFFAAVLWELGKLGFTTYLHFSTGYAKFYGSIAILPLFMLWIYLTWLTVLFGMQASYALQNFSRLVDSKLKSLTDSGSKPAALIDPMIALSVAKEVQRAFDSGAVCTGEMVKNSTKLELSQSIKLLDVLTEAGITNRIYSGDEFKGWAPTRPAEKIKLDDVLRAAYQIDGFRTSGAEEGIPSSIRGAVIDRCAQMSLADLESKATKQQ
ncbi:MAG: YihY/virulence factor BrkB family protein [Phycisphaerales bacterium]|nr:YihY/virulence factor BrkB family protein [Phycisphaerales bacterium]